MTIEHDTRAGRDPFAGRRAPEEYWDELIDIQERGERVDFREMVSENNQRVAAACGSILLEKLESQSDSTPRKTVRAFRSRAVDQAPCSV